MNGASDRHLDRAGVGVETAVLLLCVSLLVYALRPFLFTGASILVHDALYWEYPIFQSFAGSLMDGELPLWNPFPHAGEPTYPLLGHMRLLEPVTVVTVLAGQLFTSDIGILFCWNRFLQCVFMTTGAYLVLRSWTERFPVRLLLIPILFFSSFFFCSFRQHGFVFQFIWTPYVCYFLLRIVYFRENIWSNWLMLAAAIGINGQSYYFSGVSVYLLVLISGLILFRRDLIRGYCRGTSPLLRPAVAGGIVGMMMLPNVALLLERDRFVFPARMAPVGYEKLETDSALMQHEGSPENVLPGSLMMPYSLVRFSGSFATGWEFLQMTSPNANMNVSGPSRSWGSPSEAYLYVGLLPWALGVLGLFFGEHDLKSVWLFATASLGLLMLGPGGYVHPVLYSLFPPLWFLRHTHTLLLFFELSFLYFTMLGLDVVFGRFTACSSMAGTNGAG